MEKDNEAAIANIRDILLEKPGDVGKPKMTCLKTLPSTMMESGPLG